MKLMMLALVAAFGVAQANPTAHPAVDCKKPENATKTECAAQNADHAKPATATAPAKTAPVKK